MKTLISILLLFISLLSYSQDSHAIYLVGSYESVEYPAESKHVTSDNNFRIRGRKCVPILYKYIKEKDEYIGGNLINIGTGDTSKIDNMSFKKFDGKQLFIIKCSDSESHFDMFHWILMEETDTYSIFEYNGVFWRIEKP